MSRRPSTRRERYPEIEADIGEDPARFLDYDFEANDGMRTTALARIRGIDRIATVRAWIGVERALDRPTREHIIEALQEREATLEEIGERPDRLEYGPHPPPSYYQDDSEEATVSEDREGDDEEESLSAHQKLQQMRARTDGGESDAE